MESDALNRLEEKVRRTVEEMERLRQENRRLSRKSDGGNGGAAAGNDQELELLHEERAAVRSRIEGLIALMEGS